MSAPRIIQRSPDLGIGIRLQRLPAALKAVAKPPWWWGWMDASGQRATSLGVVLDSAVIPPDYWPNLWVAVVEGATDVTWEIEFTPMVWVKQPPIGSEAFVAWEGPKMALTLPLDLPAAPDILFPTHFITLPNPLNIQGSDVSAYTYWSL